MATDGTTTTDYLDDRFWREFGWRGFVLTLVSLACLNIALADLRGRHPVASLYTGADWSDPAAWTDRATWLQRRTSPGRATLPWQHDSATLVLADPARDRWHAGGLGGL